MLAERIGPRAGSWICRFSIVALLAWISDRRRGVLPPSYAVALVGSALPGSWPANALLRLTTATGSG